ncbi:hypothetical protein FS749_016343 [Ceratobasidium sp. UAMH 11750]|nr:hypothetical protein FS749_016343 [Ceratobasidium sp. UAMH 11750]
MLIHSLLSFSLLGAISVVAQQPVYAQCGGISWTGGTTCVSGTTCVKVNDYYYQCQPGTASPTTATTKATSATTGATTKPAGTTTSSAASATGTQIRSVQDPIYHLYLQNSGGTAVLASEATSGRFVIGGSIALVSSSPTQYLNIVSATTSYKPLVFNSTATTTGWGLEGDTIITTNSSPWGRQLNFLACATSTSGTYKVYFQTGSDVPSGQSCTNYVSLHLPCLC